MRRTVVFFSLLVLSACVGPLSDVNDPPVARLTASPTSGTVPFDVDLDGSGSSDADGRIVSMQLKVGTGAFETLAADRVNRTVSVPGETVFTLRVTDDDGSSSESTQVVTGLAPQPAVGEPIPEALDLDARYGGRVVSGFSVANAAQATGAATLDVGTLPDWLEVTPMQATLVPGAIEDFVVSATCGVAEDVRSHDVALATDASPSSTRTVRVTLACTAPPGSAFAIDVVPSGAGMTADRLAVFEQAAQRWSEVIVGDIPGGTLAHSTVRTYCGDFTFEGAVDDVVIFASITAIDGPGGILGEAGPCLFSSPTAEFPYMPVAGIMRFDSDDVVALETRGTFVDVILHEMGHVLHLSRFAWDDIFGLLAYEGSSCLASPSVRFEGPRAVAEWNALGGDGAVPVEENGISGTGCSHWDDETFGNELMTGYLSLDSRLSRVTAGALGDVGFDVDASAADAYALPFGTASEAEYARFQEVLLAPRGVVRPDGTVEPLPFAPNRTVDLHVGHDHAPDGHGSEEEHP